MRYFVFLGVLFFWSFYNPTCSANMRFEFSKTTYENAISKNEMLPVERVRPPDEKAKKKKKEKKKLRKTPDSPNKTQGGAAVFVILLVSFLVLFIAGAFLFGFGIYILPMAIAGLILMGVSNLIALGIAFYMTLGFSGGDSPVGNALIGAVFIFIAVLGILDFGVGLAFLIWGLLAAIPFAWIMGIVLLALFLILLIFVLLAIQKVG